MALSPQERSTIAAIDGPADELDGPQNPDQQTQEGKVQQQAAPKTEGDKMKDDPFIEVKMPNGQVRQMTNEQIAGTMDRYAKLNFRNTQLKPVLSAINSYLDSNPNMTQAQLAEKIAQFAAAEQKNVQFGRGGVNDPDGDGRSSNPNSPNLPSDDDFSRWENDNATSLPPGYKDLYSNMSQIQGGMKQMQDMMRQALGQSAGQVDAARTAQMNASERSAQTMQGQISVNLDRAQSQLRLPTEAANDFMMFAAARGYNLEDFVDPELTLMVMNDFRNNMQSDEMARLREINKRRTAFTPAGGGSAPNAQPGGQPSPEEKDFSDFSDRVMAKRRL